MMKLAQTSTTPPPSRRSPSGFTLIEVIMTALLLAIFATVATRVVDYQQNSRKYEETRMKLDAIGQAIWGDASVDNRGQRTRFGFYGDLGQLPVTLNDLVTQGVLNAWTFNTTFGVGVGWRGPYYHENITGAYNLTLDAWGHALSFNTVAVPPTVTSFGSDGAAGGTGYAQDLVLILNANRFQSAMFGYVKDGSDAITNVTVEITYPSNDALVQQTFSPGVVGNFNFSKVTMGPVAIQTTNGLTLGPKIIVVDSPEYFVPNTTLNFFGDRQLVSYQGGANTTGAGNQLVHAPIKNGYEYSLTLSSITVWFSKAGAQYTEADINGNGTNFVSALNSGNVGIMNTVVNPATIGAGATLNLNITFQATGGGNIAMNASTFSVRLQWVQTNRLDAITFTTP